MRGSRFIAYTAVFAALAAVCEILPLDLRVPILGLRLSFDPTGIFICLPLILLGFPSALISDFIAFLVIAMRGNIYGGIFKFLAELFTILGLLPFYKRSFKASVVSGVLCRILGMNVMNFILLPIFYGLPIEAVIASLPALAIFNLIQGLINILCAWILAYRLREVMKV